MTESVPVPKTAPAAPGCLRMVRDPSRYPAPHAALVDAAEVANWQLHGWTRAE